MSTDNDVMDHDAAVELDEQIQDMADKAAQHLDYLADLLVEAKTKSIYESLGFSSWTAYLAVRLKPITAALDADDRRALVVELYGAGMSMRAIAEAVDMSKSTVARQVSQGGTGEHGGETTGVDGNTYPRRNGGGGHRGPLTLEMRLCRLKTGVRNLTGLSEGGVAIQDQICELIDQLPAYVVAASSAVELDTAEA